MYSSILLLYMIISKISVVLLTIAGILVFFIIVLWIKYLCNCDDNTINRQDRQHSKFPKSDSDSAGTIMVRQYYLTMKKFTTALIIVICLTALVPKTEYVISYIALKEVDKYAEENPKSIMNPKVVFKSVDDIAGLVGKIFNLVDKGVDAASSGLDIANKNLNTIKTKK